MIYGKDKSAVPLEKPSPDLVRDVVVGKLHDVPCQVTHSVQRHGAVLKEMSAESGDKKPLKSIVSAELETSCRSTQDAAMELVTNLKAVFFFFFCLPCYFFAGQPLASAG